VAESEGTLLGYALVLFRRGSSRARLYSIARDAQRAPRGTGGALLAAAERAAAAAGALELGLEVRTDNAAALHLYETSGYRATGRRPAYYEDGADALRMTKILGKDDQ
jgi:ribosomal protein S18 acetylase RimI-like enzyme